MIQALQITPEILTSNIDNINFDIVDLRSRTANCCGWLQYMPGGSDFTLIGGGTFKVSFNANVTSTTAGQVALALKTGTGTDVEGTETDAIITTPGSYTNVSFTKIIRVCPRVNTTIAVGSIPAVGSVTPIVATQIPTIKDANLIIEKIA
ncbi:MAG: hypothetical protein J6W64_06790 [Bacilli bacterium]|nr:hypothetical protein [Bacilli bacterium]